MFVESIELHPCQLCLVLVKKVLYSRLSVPERTVREEALTMGRIIRHSSYLPGRRVFVDREKASGVVFGFLEIPEEPLLGREGLYPYPRHFCLFPKTWCSESRRYMISIFECSELFTIVEEGVYMLSECKRLYRT